MSDGELLRLEVLRDLDQKRLTTEAAAQLLGLERRQVFRLLRAPGRGHHGHGPYAPTQTSSASNRRQRRDPIVGEAYRQYIAGYDAPKMESMPASEREQGDEYDPD
jgi:hypothetical protein